MTSKDMNFFFMKNYQTQTLTSKEMHISNI